ncbi:hypothetical protein Q9R20_12375 [Microbacterium sp. PRF11]|uniref:hypothetical protein n=1 Tax=Microbacterium sp. PRF11 TaxID=2962593 RepID=UPI0028817720|nr:hypothetical protein [Microbacterium sp. PRF11]MDT0117782.1 hypothetical protein [Microbacterium sp. PRF11]
MTNTDTTPRRTSRLADLRALPPTVTIPVAGRIGWGLSRAAAYQLHQAGAFPCAVVKVGARFHVRTADLARGLGIDPALLLAEGASVNERAEP